MKKNFEYDVTLSFAGEDRNFVSCVAEQLKIAGVKIFFDEYEQVALWGKDLYTYLGDIYTNKARFCVMFISEFYKQKLWTNHERESAQARAFNDNIEYILPFRIDDTKIPGIKETTAYLSMNDYDCQKLADAIIKKLDSSNIVEKEVQQGSKKTYIGSGIFQIEDGKYEITKKKYDFFSDRLADAFPGVRELKWFTSPIEIIERLKIVFETPLIFEVFPGKNYDFGGIAKPIWWFRGGASMPIEKFEVLTETKCLIGDLEFEVDKLAVFRTSEAYRNFLYLKVKPESAIENGDDADRIKAVQLSYKNYATQSYAIYKNHFIKSEDYEDGATVINGKVERFTESPQWRTRYLTPYNIIICAQSSIYNSREADIKFGHFLDEVIKSGNDEDLETFLNVLAEIENDSPLRIDFDIDGYD